MENNDDNNQILDTALNFIEATVPGSLSDPAKAYKEIVETMGWVIIKKKDKISIEQLKKLQSLDAFEGKNLLQIKKLIESESIKIGPESKHIATELTMPTLKLIGIETEFIPLTEEEKKAKLKEVEI